MNRIQATQPEQVTITQFDIKADGKSIKKSSQYGVTLTYVPFPKISYFNLTVNEKWCVQNVPLYVAKRAKPVKQRFYFGLDSKTTQKLFYGYAITAFPLETQPDSTKMAKIHRDEMVFYPAVSRPKGGFSRTQINVQTGGHVQIFACRIDYPNQDCGENECGPTAVSNSLRWLNEKYRLGIDPNRLSINAMKEVTGWNPNTGVPHGTWPRIKERKLRELNLPFTSARYTRGQSRQVFDEFKRGQAVELDFGDHVVSVTCMGPDNESNPRRWIMNVASDMKQGNAGGTTIEQLTIDANGNFLSGPRWARGRVVQNFVVQCPINH